MCGVFGISNLVKFDLEDRFDFDNGDVIPKEFSKAVFRPHSDILTVSRNSPNKLVVRHWSLIPPWIKDLHELKYPTFNARSETVAEKATFKNAWKKGQRCLILATEFYEYRNNGEGNSKTAFKFSLPKGEPFALAGLYQAWNDIESATIITCEPNHETKEIHDRLPVVLQKKDEDTWLDSETTLEQAHKLLKPFPEGMMQIEEVESPLKRQKVSSK